MTDIDFTHVSLRLESAQDRDFLLQLYISTREAELQQTGWPQTGIHSFLRQQFEAQFHSYRQLYPDAEFQLVEYEVVPVGRLYLSRTEDEYRLIDIALLPEYRGRALGAFLIRQVMDAANANGSPVSLHVEHANPAIRLYSRLGFEVVEDRGIYLFMRWHPEG